VTLARSLPLRLVVLTTIAVASCGTGNNLPKTPTGIFIHSATADACSNSNESQLGYSIVSRYRDYSWL